MFGDPVGLVSLMSESTLSLKLSDLAGEVGNFLGWGRGVDNGDPAWSTPEQNAITSCVNSGLRQFYWPPAIDGQESAYEWSFLKPVANVALTINVATVRMPDDFGGIEGQITVQSTGSQVYWPVDVFGVGKLYAQYAEFPSATGRPCMACVEPLKGTDTTTGQRFQLRVWPLPDVAYSLQVQYYVLADALTASFPFAYGGMQHAETILESCLAIAEQRLDDAGSVHSMKFKERLVASISADRKLKPQKGGYNRDWSDRAFPEYRRYLNFPGITVRGTQY